MNTLSLVDAAYLAGLIDGEGCVAVSRTSTSASAKVCKRGFAYRSSIAVAMTDLAVLEWSLAATGAGAICELKREKLHHKRAWRWTVWSGEAAEIAKQILPFMRVKRAQAENLLAFQAAMRRPGTLGLTDEEWGFREQRHRKSLDLNKQGRP